MDINIKTFLFGLFGAGFVFFTPFVFNPYLRGLLLVMGITLMLMAAERKEGGYNDRALSK